MIIEINSKIAENLSKTELGVVNYINDNEDKLSELSIVDIAFETFSSPATVSRAIRKCGINGFNELRYKLTAKTENTEVKDLNEIMNKSLIEATSVIEHMSIPNVLNILHTMKDAKRVLIFSRGPTHLVAQELSMKLQVLDFFVVDVEDPQNYVEESSGRRSRNHFISERRDEGIDRVGEKCKASGLQSDHSVLQQLQ